MLMPVTSPGEAELRNYYSTLAQIWGNPHWWPAGSRLEVIVGAYLTQDTSWNNVERALRSLRQERALSLDQLRTIPIRRLELVIRSAGYFRQKARRLKTFVAYLDTRYRGSLSRMFAQSTSQLREELLALDGVGPETADSILLYAGQRPVFVVDAYTRRILDRHRLMAADSRYEDIRAFCERSLAASCRPAAPLPRGEAAGAAGAWHTPSRMSRARRAPLAQIYNEMHGLIVGVGKNYCLKSGPKCEQCPLRKFLPGEQAA